MDQHLTESQAKWRRSFGTRDIVTRVKVVAREVAYLPCGCGRCLSAALGPLLTTLPMRGISPFANRSSHRKSRLRAGTPKY